MRHLVVLYLLLITLICLHAFEARAQKKKAIICLTYDDALESQLKIALPQLDSFGMKATFFLTAFQGTSGIVGKGSPTLYQWRMAALNGHELGNHTLFHPCPEKFGWNKETAIETYTVDQLINEIEASALFLNQVDHRGKKRSYAFPCNVTVVQGIDYTQHLKNSGLVSYARDGGDSNSIVRFLTRVDPMHVPSWHVMKDEKASDLIAFAEAAKKVNGIGIYQFHDIDGQLFSISSQSHRALLQYLKLHDNDFEVMTFTQAMEFMSKEKK